jgi:hypothetical protein
VNGVIIGDAVRRIPLYKHQALDYNIDIYTSI